MRNHHTLSTVPASFYIPAAMPQASYLSTLSPIFPFVRSSRPQRQGLINCRLTAPKVLAFSRAAAIPHIRSKVEESRLVPLLSLTLVFLLCAHLQLCACICSHSYILMSGPTTVELLAGRTARCQAGVGPCISMTFSFHKAFFLYTEIFLFISS